MTTAPRSLLGLVALVLSGAPLAAQEQGNPWAAVTAGDVAFVRDAIATKDIYAILGDPAFKRDVDRATAQAVAAAPTARSVADYQAVLKRYLGALQDPHARVSFTLAPTALHWAGFLVRMRGARYYVVGSQDDRIVDGAEVESCDGRPLDRLLDERAPLEDSIPGLQSVRGQMARSLTVDAGNPFIARAAACRIAGASIALDWRPISADALAVANARFAPLRDPTVWWKPFGADGEWVHMGVFQASTQQVADQYHALYAQLPAMRNKQVIVVDVRGNGGGSYNWFMGFLRGLYGDDAAAYYARARLKIHPLYADDPAKPDPMPAGATQRIAEPEDAPLVKAEGNAVRTRLPNGRFVYRTPPVPGAEDPVAPPPPTLVHARVLLLTDNGCGSACIAFADEMRRFPGVTQIGADTFVDRLSGTPVTTPLPSGNGSISLPSMIRYGRERGDNVPRTPAIRYDGDMADTAAVQAWIVNTVLPATTLSDRAPTKGSEPRRPARR